jgi:hypothetical protein
VENGIAYARAHGASTLEWYEQDLINPKLQPVLDLWTQLERTPGNDRIPTVVTVQPAKTTAVAGRELTVTVRVSAPGISGFSPGGTVILSDDSTGRHLNVANAQGSCAACIDIAPGTGSVTVPVVVPPGSNGYINLSGWYLDKFVLPNGTPDATGLWMQSRSVNTRINVVAP